MKKLLVLILLAGCATAPAPQSTPQPAPAPYANATVADPSAITAIEEQLMNVNVGTLRYMVETRGTVTMIARGTALWRPDILRVDVSGTIDGEEKGRRHEPEPVPPNGKRALVQGFVRMGITHNLYRVLNGQNIEGEEQGLQNVEVTNVRHVESQRQYLFDIVVNGARIGEVQLWLQPDGRPSRREQTVHFPNGDMHVTENYQWIM